MVQKLVAAMEVVTTTSIPNSTVAIPKRYMEAK